MTSRVRKSVGRVRAVLEVTSSGASVIALACLFLLGFAGQHALASTKQHTAAPTKKIASASTKQITSAPTKHIALVLTKIVPADVPLPRARQQQYPIVEKTLEKVLEQAEPTELAPLHELNAGIAGPPDTADTDSASHPVPGAAPTPEPDMDEVNQYLWGVYERTATKRDGTGDFTWKDVAAAAHVGKTLGDYVIVGMDRDFRELLYHAGLAMDAAGMRWTILSAFRDDYRQGLAAGYKARIGDSLHGGSATTGGYGHGCAVDITDTDGKAVPLWRWVDANSAQISLERPLPGIDPAHIQARGPWHTLAAALRNERLAKDQAKDLPSEDVPADSELADLSTVPPSEADLRCTGLHHHRTEPIVASAAPEAVNFDATRAHIEKPVERPIEKTTERLIEKSAEKSPSHSERLAERSVEKPPSRSEKSHPHTGTRLASRSPSSNSPAAEADKARGKAFRALPKHALHAVPRTGTS